MGAGEPSKRQDRSLSTKQAAEYLAERGVPISAKKLLLLAQQDSKLSYRLTGRPRGHRYFFVSVLDEFVDHLRNGGTDE
jgi:hypothetical protein